MLVKAKLTDINIVIDNDLVSIFDNGKLITEGSGRKFHVMARNVIDRSDPKDYLLKEKNEGHKRIVTLCPKVNQ